MQCIIVRTSIPKIETDDLHVPIYSIVSGQREYGTIQYSEVWKCNFHSGLRDLFSDESDDKGCIRSEILTIIKVS